MVKVPPELPILAKWVGLLSSIPSTIYFKPLGELPRMEIKFSEKAASLVTPGNIPATLMGSSKLPASFDIS